MSVIKYVLDEQGEPQIEPDLLTWGVWFEDIKNTRVGRTVVDDIVEVSTVFLGLNHNYGEGPPILFETMIFGGEHDGEQWRYATKAKAAEGHERIVKMLKNINEPIFKESKT